jgi:two-component system, cell cycle response regulator DivK
MQAPPLPPLGECLVVGLTKYLLFCRLVLASLSTTFPQSFMSFQNFSSSSTDCIQPLILAVDDNEDNLQLLSQVLVIMNCSFVTAQNGEDAIAMAQQYQPKLILLDMMLPDLSGIEVANYLKQNPQTRQISIIAVTAMARGEDKERFAIAGCDDCVTKPYVIDELEAIICRYIS